MRKSQILLGAIAALSMGFYSCSSEDAPNVNGGNASQKGDKYIAVNIRTAGMTGTRAAGEGFEEGTDAEGTVTTANTRFYFFDETGEPFGMESVVNVNGTSIVSNMVTPQSVTPKPNTTDGNDTAGEAVLILGKAAGQGFQGVVPAQAICVVGLTDAQFDNLKNNSLTSLKDEVSTYISGSSFIMTTSNWEGTNELGAVNIADKVAGTVDAAKANPADFYLDRLAVKVRIDNNSLKAYISQAKGGGNAKYTIFNADGTKKEVELQVVLDGWQLVNTSSTAYLFKNLSFTDPGFNWNAPDYHRSYWAATAPSAVLENKTFDILGEGWKTATDVAYTNEYTKGSDTAASLNDRNSATPAIAIRGHVQIKGADNSWSNIDLVRYAGTYYELGTFKYMVMNAYNQKNNASVKVEDVKLVLDADNVNTYNVTVNGNVFDSYDNILYWNGGATSFYLNIQHAAKVETNGEGESSTTVTTPIYGLVRNHIYGFEFENVVGLGIPGNGPTDITDNETFVAARLNVLNWKVVSNKVVLE